MQPPFDHNEDSPLLRTSSGSRRAGPRAAPMLVRATMLQEAGSLSLRVYAIIALTLIEFFAVAIVLKIGWFNSCSAPLAWWLLGYEILQVVNMLCEVLMSRGFDNASLVQILNNSLSLPMFILGNIYVFSGIDCNPLLLTTALFVIIIAYAKYLLPMLFISCVFCGLAIPGLSRFSTNFLLLLISRVTPPNPNSLSPEELNSLDQEEYIPNRNIAPEDAECSICLDSYEERAMIRFLPCRHHFHTACIDRWLVTRPFCPLCKHNVRDPPPKRGGDVEQPPATVDHFDNNSNYTNNNNNDRNNNNNNNSHKDFDFKFDDPVSHV